jgi:hypothetical protein
LEEVVSKTYRAVKPLAVSKTLPQEQIQDQQEFLIRHLMPLLAFVIQYHPDNRWRDQAAAAQAGLQQLEQLVLHQ